jgi:DNA-directed RNA polymerase subunit RPC12/RpoP
MAKLPQKNCPKCDSILERIYHRQHVGNTQPYMPIGYMCPVCCEEMIVLDIGHRKQDGYDGIVCPECQGRLVALVDETDEKLKCLSCKYIFVLTPTPKKPAGRSHIPTYDEMRERDSSDRERTYKTLFQDSEKKDLVELSKQEPRLKARLGRE